MPDTKRQEGFVILDQNKVPEDLTHEIKHYNGLVKLFDGQPKQKMAIINSENKITKLLKINKNIYPMHVVYGCLSLIRSLQESNSNPVEFKNILNKLKKEHGEAYFIKLVLFEPQELFTEDSKWGWSHADFHSVDLNATAMNIFMLSVKSGKLHFVRAILDSIDDIELKKKVLLQTLQHRGIDNQMVFKPILDLAIESGSSELIDYLMSTMKALDILPQAANAYGTLVSTPNNSTNLLRKSVELNNLVIINVILKYKEHLGRLLYLLPDNPHPFYITNKYSFEPVFLSAIAHGSPELFGRLVEETFRSVDLQLSDDYFEANYKMDVLISSMAMIDLDLYILHPDFNPDIFSKILYLKIQLDQKLESLSVLKSQFVRETGIPLPISQNGIDFDAIRSRELLWGRSGPTDASIEETKEFFALPSVIERIFSMAMLEEPVSEQPNNLPAAARILHAYIRLGSREGLNQIINRYENLTDYFNNYLLEKAIENQDPNLIETITQNRFRLNDVVFKRLSMIEDPQSFIFIAKELFHNLHANKLSYDGNLILSTLEKVRDVAESHNSDENLSEAVQLFLEDMHQNTWKLNINIDDLLTEISNANGDQNRPGSISRQ